MVCGNLLSSHSYPKPRTGSSHQHACTSNPGSIFQETKSWWKGYITGFVIRICSKVKAEGKALQNGSEKQWVSLPIWHKIWAQITISIQIKPLSILPLTRTESHFWSASHGMGWSLLVNFRIHKLKKASFLDKQVHETPVCECAAAVVSFLKKKRLFWCKQSRN